MSSLAALDRRFRKLDAAFDSALTSGNAAEVERAGDRMRSASAALYNAVPRTLQDVVIVLRHVIGDLRAADDPSGNDLIPRLRRLRIRLARQRASVGLDDLVELRAIARVSESVCDGGGVVTWIAQWLYECVACLSRPRLV